MKSKVNNNRKQKRVAKRILIFGLVAAGAICVVAVSTFAFIMVQNSKPLFISPLPSFSFAQQKGKDEKFELLKKTLKKERIAYDKIEKTEDEAYIVQLKNGGEVTFSSQKDIIAQIASLQFILSHLTMEGKLFSRLDLRFEKPVIVLK